MQWLERSARAGYAPAKDAIEVIKLNRALALLKLIGLRTSNGQSNSGQRGDDALVHPSAAMRRHMTYPQGPPLR
jgi:hypothetical protein